MKIYSKVYSKQEVGAYCIDTVTVYKTNSNHLQFIPLQLNVKRATERRAPQPMQHVNQPFDKIKFNFNKVKSGEVLFNLQNSDRAGSTNDRVIINVSM